MRPKSFRLVWRCNQFLSGFLNKYHLPRVLRQSRLSTNAKGDNEMIPDDVHRSPGIYLTAEENSVSSIQEFPEYALILPLIRFKY